MAKRYRAVAFCPATGESRAVFPRSRRTHLFASRRAAERALDRYSRRLPSGWQGRIYLASALPEDSPVLYMALS